MTTKQPNRYVLCAKQLYSLLGGPTAPVLSYRSSVGSTAQLTNAQLHVIKGTDFSVNCSGSSSIPSPTYRWTSHTYRWTGEKMSNYSMVSFNNIDTTDHGQYVCTVENTMVRTIGNIAYGNNSNAVFIEILSKYCFYEMVYRRILCKLLTLMTNTGRYKFLFY